MTKRIIIILLTLILVFILIKKAIATGPVGDPDGDGVWATAIEEYKLPEDGNDWSHAFNRFFAGKGGELILRPSTTYWVGQTVNICRRGVVIRGGGAESTFVTTSFGGTAFAIRYVDWCFTAGYNGNYGRLATITNLTIRENGSNPNEAPARFGVLIEAPGHLENVTTQGFSNGIRIDADVNRAGNLRSNANHWTLTRVETQESDHTGIVVRGGDSNAGIAIGVSAVVSCRRHLMSPVWLGSCAGIEDASFLGNTWIQPHVAVTNGQPPYRTGTANQRSVFIAPYREGTTFSFLAANDVSIGGMVSWNGGVSLIGRNFNNLTLVRPTITAVSGDTDTTPAIMYWQAANGDLFHVERNNNDFRGSWKGANSYYGWYWTGSTPRFTPRAQ